MNTTTLPMPTRDEIKQFILETYQTKNISEMSKILGVKYQIVTSCYKQLTQDNLVPKVGKPMPKKKQYKPTYSFADESTYKNGKGVNKGLSRDKTFEAIQKSKPSKKPMLTLCADECELEQSILNNLTFPSVFIAPEIKRTVFNKLCIKIGKLNLPINPICSPVRDLIDRANADEYSHINLDYCGQLGLYYEDIEETIKRNIVEVGGTISITLNKRISTNIAFYELLERLNPKRDTDESTRTEHAILTLINRLGGLSYAIETVFNYHDTTSMILVVIRRLS